MGGNGVDEWVAFYVTGETRALCFAEKAQKEELLILLVPGAGIEPAR